MKRSAPPPRATTAEEFVRARDARGLFWSLVARLIFVGIFFLLSALHLLDLIAPGVAAETDFEAYASLAFNEKRWARASLRSGSGGARSSAYRDGRMQASPD